MASAAQGQLKGDGQWKTWVLLLLLGLADCFGLKVLEKLVSRCLKAAHGPSFETEESPQRVGSCRSLEKYSQNCLVAPIQSQVWAPATLQGVRWMARLVTRQTAAVAAVCPKGQQQGYRIPHLAVEGELR